MSRPSNQLKPNQVFSQISHYSLTQQSLPVELIPFNEREYHLIADNRTKGDRLRHRRDQQFRQQRAIKTFNITLTDRAKIVYEPSQPIRIDNVGGIGWYCYVTDSHSNTAHYNSHQTHSSNGKNTTNLNINRGIQSKSIGRNECSKDGTPLINKSDSYQYSVLTVHGAPGNHIEWAGLQKEIGPGVRWVNLTIPGFDSQDERRGSYDGSAEHLSQLIVGIINKLQLGPVLFIGHSLGSIFFTYFYRHYPQYVRGYVNVTGIVDNWYTGLLVFYQISVAKMGYNSPQWRTKRLLDSDSGRQSVQSQFLNARENVSFGPVVFPKLGLTQICAYIRLINSMPNGVSQLYQWNRELPIPQLLIFGEKDPLHSVVLVEATFHRHCNRWVITEQCNQIVWLKLIEKGYVNQQEINQYSIARNVNTTHPPSPNYPYIQQYLCYILPDTGHNAHRRRPKQLAQLIHIYMTIMTAIEQTGHKGTIQQKGKQGIGRL